MRLTRIVWYGNGITMLMFLAAGCGKPVTSGASKPAATDGRAAATPADPAAPADEFAAAFVMGVQSGNAKPEQLTIPFKKLIAEPVLEADRSVGYSVSEVEKWLKQYAGTTFKLNAKPIFQSADAAGFVGMAGDRRFTLRLRKATNGWAVDWFAPVGPTGVSIPAAATSAEAFAAIAFLDAVVTKSERLAEGMLTMSLKAREAPPFSSDKERGYNRGVLQRRLEAFRSGATHYNLTAVNGSMATGTLGDKPFALKLAKGSEPGIWLVDSFEAR